MKNRYSILIALLVVAFTPVATYCRASEQAKAHAIGVVELFTSQGCSSCPRADASLNQIADDPDVVAISYHVDYWNYLGWEDTLAVKENTERQYAYGKALGSENVFTPQIVLNGVRNAHSTSADVILAQLKAMKYSRAAPEVPLTARMQGEELEIEVGSGSGKANVVVAYYKKKTVVDIASGENTGKQVTYRNAVAKMETVGMWDGKPLTVKLPTSALEKRGFDGCAILLQSQDRHGNPGRIHGAVALSYPD